MNLEHNKFFKDNSNEKRFNVGNSTQNSLSSFFVETTVSKAWNKICIKKIVHVTLRFSLYANYIKIILLNILT